MPNSKSALRLAAVAIFLLLALAYFYFGWNEVLTLETLQQQRSSLQARVQAQPLLSAASLNTRCVGLAAFMPGGGVESHAAAEKATPNCYDFDSCSSRYSLG